MSTRLHKKSMLNLQKQQHVTKYIANSWVLMVKETLLENPSFTIITLPHPSDERPTKYCLDILHKKMYEIVTFNEPYRSWFIGETVKSDGSILMVTPFNPIFLVLSRLRKQCTSRAIPIEDLLSEKGFDRIQFVNLDQVADVKGAGDIKAYKYSEEKTIGWLETRVRALAKVLRDKNIHVTSGAASATFISSNATTVDEELYLKYAFGIVSEYLDDYFNTQLEKHFKFTEDIIEYIGNKRKTEEENINKVCKKIKYETDNGQEENINSLNVTSPEVKVQKQLTAKEKARQKAASGTKSISAFFTKK